MRVQLRLCLRERREKGMERSVRNALACALTVLLTVAAMPAHAAKEVKAEPAVVIQNQPDRQISPSKPLAVHAP